MNFFSFADTENKGFRLFNQKGFMSAEWMAATLVLMIPAFVVAFSMTQFPSRKHLTQVAAESAARAYVDALDQETAETAARTAAVETILKEFPSAGINGALVVSTGEDSARGVKVEVTTPSGTYYCPGSEISIRVTIPMPILIDPFDSSSSVRGSLSSSATERIDDYSEIATSSLGDPDGNNYDINDQVKCPNA